MNGEEATDIDVGVDSEAAAADLAARIFRLRKEARGHHEGQHTEDSLAALHELGSQLTWMSQGVRYDGAWSDVSVPEERPSTSVGNGKQQLPLGQLMNVYYSGA